MQIGTALPELAGRVVAVQSRTRRFVVRFTEALAYERCSPGTARDSQPTRRRAQTGGDGIGVAALVRKPATWD